MFFLREGGKREERARNERAASGKSFLFGGAAPTQRQLLIDEKFVPGGIRDITPHLIHHSKGLTVQIYVVLHEESRGYDPESILQRYELCRFEGTQRSLVKQCGPQHKS